MISHSSELPGRAKVGQVPSMNSPMIWRDETIVLARQHWLNYFNPDGTPGWVNELTPGQPGQPALADEGMIYVADNRHTLYALDRRGETRWQYEADGTVNGSPVVGQDGTVFITTARSVHALSPDGPLKWKVKSLQQCTSSPAVAADGTLYIGGDAGLFALHPDGTEEWSMRAGTANGSPTIAADRTIYFACGYLWVCATRDEGSPLAKSSWPKMHHDPANSSRILTKF
jgi:outer membrane protein assembly factor BamB